ncbi:MAG: ATP-dependent helicase, partial [Chitinophagaceae bacterium]|nr:ATP-dependent helicase [Chitinophagaceae bacterium]
KTSYDGPEPDNQRLSLTQEQTNIINSTADIRINAVAGSGKTTTIIEYAAAKSADSRILYLAFNKSVKLEAIRRFAARGLNNVKVETAHSLAYKHIVPRYNYKVKTQGYKTHEIADLLGLRGNGEKHAEYIIANHINKFITYFCNSDKLKVQELNYLDTVADKKTKTFVKALYKYIEDGTRLLLSKMDKGEIEILHDFYLKKFQLTNPVLPYDYILFDEGQDASAAMLDIFLKQKATKVIVGDTHQQIYAWRHAVNSLEKTNFKTFHLTTSFRFRQDIADLAAGILQWKNHLVETKPAFINGQGTSSGDKVKATIARTNLGLLLKAIEFIQENKKVKYLYFEGNIHSYTYADDGTSLYDVLNLSNHRHDLIRDKLIKSMKDMVDLEDYIEKTEDVQLAMMVEIVNEYGNEIPGILKSLKEKHTGDEERSKAEMIFSTVHRAKGMEYDEIELVNDFISESKLERLKAEQKSKEEPLDMAKLNEEINLLYVAATRTKHQLKIPQALIPKGFLPTSRIQVLNEVEEAEDILPPYPYNKANAGHAIKKYGSRLPGEKFYSVAPKREFDKGVYKPWTAQLDNELKEMFEKKKSIVTLAKHFGRTSGAIQSRLKKLNFFTD